MKHLWWGIFFSTLGVLCFLVMIPNTIKTIAAKAISDTRKKIFYFFWTPEVLKWKVKEAVERIQEFFS